MADVDLLPWQTKFFGIRFGSLHLRGGENAKKISTALAKSNCDFVIARIPTSDARMSTAVEDAGFRVKDIRAHLDIQLHGLKERKRDRGTEFGEYRVRDLPSLREIASSSFSLDHFHQDERFDPKKINEMYALWIEKCVREGYAIYTAHKNGTAAGFVAAKNDSGSFYIELVAVAERFRKIGVATDLVGYSLEKAKCNYSRSRVALQLANTAAIRVYEKLGFRVNSSEYTFHWWRV